MAFWKKIFKSKYTGAEIDAAVAKAADATKVVANPTLAGTESALTGLEVGETKYKVDSGIILYPEPEPLKTKYVLNFIKVGDNEYSPACTAVEAKKMPVAVANGAVLSRNDFYTLTVTPNGSSEYPVYPSDVELFYTPSASVMQSLITTGSGSETINESFNTDSNIKYDRISIGMGSTFFYPLFYCGLNNSGNAVYQGTFGVKNDVTLGTGVLIMEVTLVQTATATAIESSLQIIPIT